MATVPAVPLLNCLVPEFIMKWSLCSPTCALLPRTSLPSCSGSWGNWKGYVCRCAFWKNGRAPSLLLPALTLHQHTFLPGLMRLLLYLPCWMGSTHCSGWEMCARLEWNSNFHMAELVSFWKKCQHKILVRNGKKTIKRVSIFPHTKPPRY